MTNFCDEEDIKLLGYKSKNDLIEFASISGVKCLPNESVRAIYRKLAGRSFEDLEDEHNKQNLNNINNRMKVQNKCFYIDFSNGLFNRFDLDKTFYYNEYGIFAEGEQVIRNDIIFYDVSVVELDGGELKEIKNFSDWLTVSNNYFKIKKISNFGIYYISFKKLKTNHPNILETFNKQTDPDTPTPKRRSLTKKELEKIESDKSIENISNNLNTMLINERAMEMLKSNTITKVNTENYVIDLIKKLPESTTVFIKP